MLNQFIYYNGKPALRFVYLLVLAVHITIGVHFIINLVVLMKSDLQVISAVYEYRIK